MTVVFRVDASTLMGSGHVMRCLTLADALSAGGADVSFICRELPGNYAGHIEARGYRVHRLPEPEAADSSDIAAGNEHARWLGVTWLKDADQTKAVLENLGGQVDGLVVDHYALDKEWECRMRPHVRKIMVVDDLADRLHDGDLLLDQNLYDSMETRYQGLVPEGCKVLTGPAYALLRPEFADARQHLRERDGAVKRILIFFGGSDPSNETGKALEAIRMLDRPDISVDVVVGASNPHRELMRKACEAMPNTVFHCQVSNMAELMVGADLLVGAGGTTSWERCCLGLPGIMVVIADNQQGIAESLAKADTGCCLGRAGAVDAAAIGECLKRLTGAPDVLRRMSQKAFALCDGKGTLRVAERVLRA